MLIQCTKILLDEMNIKPVTAAEAEENAVSSWHANLLTVNHRKTVVIVNDSSRFPLVLYGLKKKDFKDISTLIQKAVRLSFEDICIDNEVIEQYLAKAGEIIFTRTKDRSNVARMNKACEFVRAYSDKIIEGKVIQSLLSRKISSILVGSETDIDEYEYPREMLYLNLDALSVGPVVKCRAAVMNVRLDLNSFDVWRKLIVPLSFTFEMLHKTLQVAFGWKNSHLHEFYLYGERIPLDWSNVNHPGFHRDGYRPVLNIVSADNEEAFSYPNDVEMKSDKDLRLSDFINSDSKVEAVTSDSAFVAKYIYDFGDNWQHYIKVEEVIDSDKYWPVCIDGAGDAPPEDVGGSSGFEDFTRVMKNEYDPEYSEYEAWAKNQGYEGFDIEKVNRWLKLLKGTRRK